jgi:hypothetical protein
VPDDPATDSLDALLKSLRGPLDWRAVTAADSDDAWTELRDWVSWLTDRYVLDHRVIPPCWYRHGAVVDVLTALRDHHRCAFDDLQPPTAAGEWHRVFRDLEPRLRDWAARTGCTTTMHRPDVAVTWPDDRDDWAQHLHTERAARR